MNKLVGRLGYLISHPEEVCTSRESIVVFTVYLSSAILRSSAHTFRWYSSNIGTRSKSPNSGQYVSTT